MSDTLAQKYLIELLMWNASYVQKKTSVNLTGTVWMIRGEKLCEGKLSTSLLEGFTCSDAAQSDCENRTVVWFENSGKSDMPVLGLAGGH